MAIDKVVNGLAITVLGLMADACLYYLFNVTYPLPYILVGIVTTFIALEVD